MKLAVKLAVCLAVGGAIVLAGLGWWVQRAYRAHSEEMLEVSAERITDVIRSSTRYQMLKNDREALYHIIRDFGVEPGIRRVRIFNKEGEIRFSTDAGEVGRIVDKNAEACFGCHAQSAPLEKLDRPDRARIFNGADGHRVLAAIRPIENQPDCASAPCHAHPAEQKVLGVIDAHLSLEQVDQHLAEQQGLFIRFAPVALLGLTLVSGVFIWAVVYRPVRELMSGTRKVASGDLEHRLPVRSKDELGELASEFNHMTDDLQVARAELRAWNSTLEDRVQHKTRELEQAHRTLLQSEKLASVGKLAATVAHEVNNPLFGILTNARLALRQLTRADAPEEVKRKISDKLIVIERESGRCGDIVKNLLMFSRQAPQHMEAADLNVVVDRVLAVVGHQLELRNIQLELQLAGDAPRLLGDANQLQQVVLAIVMNAVDVMAQGGTLAIKTEQEGEDVIVRIRDNGIGIPPDVLPRIFDPFFSTKDDQQRTGLGLAVASSIVEQHHGKISVSSKEGAGTEFTISFPRLL